jgi:hypothetical protein
MRLRELKFPIAIRFPNELEGGRECDLHGSARFDWTLAVAYQDGRFDNVEIIDCSGQAYRVEKIYFMRPTFRRWFLDRLGNLLILPRLDKREIVRVDMELEETRKLDLEQFKVEFRELILSHPAWWKRRADRTKMEGIFLKSATLADAINEIGSLSPADNLIYRGKSEKIEDLR